MNKWNPIFRAPHDQDVEVWVTDGVEEYRLGYPCRRTEDGWIVSKHRTPFLTDSGLGLARAELKSGRAPSQPLERPKIADGSSLSWKPSRLLQDLAIRHISIVPSAGVSARPRPTCSVAGRSGTASNRAASGRRKPCGCRGLNLVSDSRGQAQILPHTPLSTCPELSGRRARRRRPAPIDHTSQAAPALRRRARADKTIRGEPAMTWATIAPTLYSVDDRERPPRASEP